MPNVRWLLALITGVHRGLYHATHGVIGHRIPLMDLRFLLLLHVGHKTGRRYTVPLLYVMEGTDYVIVGSNAGDTRDPAWWRNLKVHPDARVQVGAEEFAIRARLAVGEERRRIFSALVARYRNYARYERATEGRREIPVVVLART